MANISKTEILDPEGDLKLIVGAARQGTVTKTFLVSQKVMTMASAKWKTALSGKFQKTTKDTVYFPDDDPTAFLTILLIVHVNFGRVPKKKLPFGQLTELAKFIHKYKLLHVTVPFWKSWVLPVAKKDLFAPGKEEYLFITWLFGLENAFTALAKHLAVSLEYKIKDEGKEKASEEYNHCLEGLDLPAGIVKSIEKVGDAAVTSILSLCTERADRFLSPTTPPSGMCQYGSEQCNALLMGSFVAGLRDMDFWPIPEDEDVFCSVSGIAHQLQSINLHQWPETTKGFQKVDHKLCVSAFSLVDDVKGILESMASPLLPEHRNRMKAHAEILGTQ